MDISTLTPSKERTFACLETLRPCMIKFRVAIITAVLEPGTAASATAEVTRFLDDTALGTPLVAFRG